MLFNLYLEEALSTTEKLKEMVRRGDLLAFADDMLILTNSKAEMTQAIKELDGLSEVWNLRLNKSKSQVLTEDKQSDIAGIPCVTSVKYLGVPVHLDQKAQREKWTWTLRRPSHACWPEVSWCTLAHPWLQPAFGRGMILTAWRHSSSER